MPKDIELEVLHPQALAAIHTENAEKQRRAVELANKAELRARNVESEAGVNSDSERVAIRRIGDQIRYSPALYPWMRAYAEWITLSCVELPSWTQRCTKARFFALSPVNRKQVALLEARADYVAYVNDLRSGPLERARNRFMAAFPEYIDAHKQALDAARDAGDYTAMARIAEPVLDRVMPKKTDGAAAPQVTITLSANQLAGVSATYAAPALSVDEVIAEVVEE